ncbi:gfo/Idh/MocA family oxidoreductase, partial [Klebsiella pneumoniae]|nr:gfo/Idh/MocA family oxidoreductase [Klebsiella pneumoniae]
RRWDEQGNPYESDAEDAVFAQMELEGGIFASVNSSWCSRIRRDDVVTIQIDGTNGSAVAGPQDCFTQPDGNTPNPVLPVENRQPV